MQRLISYEFLVRCIVFLSALRGSVLNHLYLPMSTSNERDFLGQEVGQEAGHAHEADHRLGQEVGHLSSQDHG